MWEVSGEGMQCEVVDEGEGVVLEVSATLSLLLSLSLSLFRISPHMQRTSQRWHKASAVKECADAAFKDAVRHKVSTLVDRKGGVERCRHVDGQVLMCDTARHPACHKESDKQNLRRRLSTLLMSVSSKATKT